MKTRIFLWLILLLCISPVSTQANDQREFLAAKDAFRTGNLTAFDRHAAQMHNPLLQPYLDYWRINLQLASISNPTVQDWILHHTDTPLSARLQIDWLRQLAKRNDWHTFSEQYPQIRQPDDDMQCLDWQADLALGSTVPKEAVAFWRSGALLPASCYPVYQQLFNQQVLNEQDAWLHARNALAANSQPAALEAFNWMGNRPLEQTTLSSIASNPSNWLDHGHDLTQPVERELTRYAIYRLAWHDAQSAAEQWRNLQNAWDDTERRRVWGQIAIQASRQHLPQAEQWFTLSAPALLGDDGLAWQVRAALLNKNWASIQKSIQNMSDSARAQPAWQYWLARSELAQGQSRAANLLLLSLSRNPDFYGLLAQEELGDVASAPSINYNASDEDIADINRQPGIRRAFLLYDMDMHLDASREWKWATRDFTDAQLLAAAELAKQHRWLDCAINTADRTHNLHNFDLSFMAPYHDTAHAYAQTYQLDEAWVYGLIRQESRFISHAHSGVGASGLMQVMPATAHWIAQKLGLRHFHTAHLNEPQTSLQFGMYYLKTIRARLGNSSLLATAAYNAGPNRALRWRPGTPIEGAIYAETIPFGETRDYVKKVFANSVFYARNFNQPDVSIKQRLGMVMPATAAPCPNDNTGGSCGAIP